ncbi:MAG: aminotransferase class III-fold pyridoxal phosphate-dependent enzyme [Caldilineaceae bacterium]|nr:aminotransferase class III-fold pyridoxal phosphate-dependent enzyme [Caldilineaceae bacterium]
MHPINVTEAPRFSAAEAAEVVRAIYDVSGEIQALPSERDQNFALLTPAGERYVLKIANGHESRAQLECQNAAMARVAAATGKAPRVIPTQTGARMATVAGPAGMRHAVRLVTYLPGEPLAGATPHTPELLAEAGALLGECAAALADFDHPAAHRDFAWDLRNGPRLIAEYAHLLPEGERAAALHLSEQFIAYAESPTAVLRTSVIHGDGNDYNILVRPGRTADAGQSGWTLHVSGLIDFGDLIHSWTAGEAAIVAAYAMLGKRDPLAAGAAVAGGFHAACPLLEQEVDRLYDLIRLRLTMSMIMAARQQAAAPDNSYLSISQQPIRTLMQRLESIPPGFARATLRQACGLPPVPATTHVVEWLQSGPRTLSPVTPHDFSAPDQFVADLSVGTPLLAQPPASGDAVTIRVRAAMTAQGASAAATRYGEARFIAYAPSAADATDGVPEQPTIPLGVELFLPAGTPVYAPTAGAVHRATSDGSGCLMVQHATDGGVRFCTSYRNIVCSVAAGQTVAAGEQIAVTRGDGAPLRLQLIVDHLGLETDFPFWVRPGEGAIWQAFSPDPNLLLGIPASCFPPAGRSPEKILRVRQEKLGRNLSVSYRKPVKIVRGWQQFLYDDAGRAYLDGVNNVSHVGHSHPRVVEAGQRQMQVLNTNSRYLHDNIADYAEHLLAYFPDPLSVVFFVCSGSEANELALRLARTATGRYDVIMLDAAYHGNTQALVDISPYKHDGSGGRGAPPWAHRAVMPDPYRGPWRGYSPETGAAYAGDIARILDEHPQRVAAFIAESVLGCGGQIVLPDGYLAQAYAHVRGAGGVCIADEVQVGFGRVGSHFWGFESQGVIPDIVTLGKPMGNGHPLAAVVTTPAIADAFANGMEYFNTFGGNPVSCAMGQAVLDVIEAEQLQEHAATVGAHLLAGLRDLMSRHGLVGDVRGAGLFAGVELVTDRETLTPAPEHASYIANRMRERGIFISTDGPLHNVLKLKPPLVFDAADADRLTETLDEVLGESVLRV